LFSRFILILFFFLTLFHKGHSQSDRIDSLTQRIKEYSGTLRVDALNEYASAIFSFDYKKAIDVAAGAYQEADRLHYPKGMAQSLITTGIIQSRRGHDSLSIRSFRKGLSLARKANDELMEGRLNLNLGILHQNEDRLDSAEIYYNRSFQLLKDSVNPFRLSLLYLHLGKFYEVQNNRPLQLLYLNKSWKIQKKINEKSSLVEVGVQIASYYTYEGNYQQGRLYLDTVVKALGKDTLNNEEINIINRQKAIIFSNQGNYRNALALFEKAKKFYERNLFPLDLANLLTEIGNVLSDVSNYETSLKYYFKALQLTQFNHYTRETTKLHFRVAWVYYLLEQDKLSEEFCRKALKEAQTHNYHFEEAAAINLLGLLADRNNEDDEALDYFNAALGIREKNNYRVGVASTLLNIGVLYEKLKDFNKAKEYDLRGLAIEEKLNHAIGMCYAYQSLGQLYIKMNDFEGAYNYLVKGEALAKKIKTTNILRDIYKNQRDLYRKQLKYPEAIRYSILFDNLKDSLFNNGLSNRISTMQYDFQLDQKEKEIEILGQQKELQQRKLELQQAEIKQQRYIIIVGLIVFFNICVGAFIILRFYRKEKKLNKEIFEQNEEITLQSEELKEANNALNKLNREISEQKEEIQAQAEELTESNQTISRVNTSLEEKVMIRTAELKEAYNELDTFFYRSSHDFRRPLTTFMGLAEVAKVTIKDHAALELFEKVNETARNLDKMLQKLQSISAVGTQELLYSEVLLDQIFQIELDNFREEIIHSSIRVLEDIKLQHPFISYPVLVKFIIQNLIENSIAFHGAQSPFIKFKAYQVANETVLEVSDNGQGIESTYLNRVFDMYFRANEKSRGNGLGLYIVKKMVDKLSGRVELKSELGFGTTVWVYLPNHFK